MSKKIIVFLVMITTLAMLLMSLGCGGDNNVPPPRPLDIISEGTDTTGDFGDGGGGTTGACVTSTSVYPYYTCQDGVTEANCPSFWYPGFTCADLQL